MKICSFLPGATEVLFALGLGDSVAGVTHECDYPAEARSKRVLVKPRIHATTSAEIDRQVSEQVAQGASLYTVDAAALAEIAPDVIITQDLCTVCAASPNDLSAVLAALPKAPRVVMFSPRTLEQVWLGIREIGDACGKGAEARALVQQARQRIAVVQRAVAGAPRPGVVCLEWLDPPYVAGHWTPEMIALAGGEDLLGRAGNHSPRVTWEQVTAAGPEVILVAPCGFSLEGALAEFRKTPRPVGWQDVPAVIHGRVHAIDANSYTSRSGPRVVDGIELLASLLHPARFALTPQGQRKREFAAAARWMLLPMVVWWAFLTHAMFPVVHFTTYDANMAAVWLAQQIPWVAVVSALSFRKSRFWSVKIIRLLGGLAAALLGLLGGLVFLLDLFMGIAPTETRRLTLSNSEVALYEQATVEYDVSVWQERRLLPGVLLVRKLAFESRAKGLRFGFPASTKSPCASLRPITTDVKRSTERSP